MHHRRTQCKLRWEDIKDWFMFPYALFFFFCASYKVFLPNKNCMTSLSCDLLFVDLDRELLTNQHVRSWSDYHSCGGRCLCFCAHRIGRFCSIYEAGQPLLIMLLMYMAIGCVLIICMQDTLCTWCGSVELVQLVERLTQLEQLYFSAFIQVVFLLTELFCKGVGRPRWSKLDQILKQHN